MKALSSGKRGAGGPPPLLIFAVVVSAVLVLWCVLYYCLTRAWLGLPILTGASALLATATGVAFVYQTAMSVPHSVERTTEPSPKWTTWRVVLRGGARGGRGEGLTVLRDLQPALCRDVSLWPGHGEFEEFEIATGVSLTVANHLMRRLEAQFEVTKEPVGPQTSSLAPSAECRAETPPTAPLAHHGSEPG